MHKETRFYTMLRLTLLLALLIPPWLPASAAAPTLDVGVQDASSSMAVPGAQVSELSHLVTEARNAAALQTAQVEPSPISIGEPLPPGTFPSEGDPSVAATPAWYQVITPLGSGFESTWVGGWVKIRTQNTVYCSTDWLNVIYTRTRTPPYTDIRDWARWRPWIPLTGWYRVYVYIPDYTHTRAVTGQAHYKINHAGGQAEVVVNQNENKCSYVFLGQYRFNSGNSGNVEMGDYTGDSTVKLIAADGMLFESIPMNPQLTNGISLNPATQGAGKSVTATFTVKNHQAGETANLQLRVLASKSGITVAFDTQSCTLAPDAECTYNQSKVFAETGSYNTCAQMQIGGTWQNIPALSGAQSCRTLNIVQPADVQLTSNLVVSPSELPPTGGNASATFSVENGGELGTTERFRAHATSGSVTFAETSDVSLVPGASFVYSDTKHFSDVGVYEIIAEHRVNGNWEALIGNGSDFVRVKAPPPPPDLVHQGFAPTCGRAGEPVNTATGNYYSDFTDMSEATPGLTLDVTRWYNTLSAPDFEGPFGYGTSWTYDMSVTWRADKTAVVRMPDGHHAYYVGQVDPQTPVDMADTYMGQDKDIGTLVRATDGTAILTLPDQTSYHFETTGHLERVSHPFPATIQVIYSGDDPIQIAHSAGITYTLAYSGAYISQIAASNGRVVSYTYTPAGDLETVTLPDGAIYTYAYDDDHHLTATADPNGHFFVRNVYDDQGRVVTQYDQADEASHFSYGSQITETRTFTDALGNLITHTHDANYYLLEEIDSLGQVITYTRNEQGSITARKDKNGGIWRYTYDDRGNKLSETTPLGHTWVYTYDLSNNLTAQTNPLGHTWLYEYDANNRLLRTIDPLGHTHEYAYDARGNLTWEKDENGATTEYAYNDLGWQVALTDSLGFVTQTAYYDLGNVQVYTDTNGHYSHFVYDSRNRLIQSVDPIGTVITYTYDGMGNMLTESDGLGHIKHFTYDEFDRVIAETDFNGNSTQYEYDPLGRLTQITDPMGYTIRFFYDALGNMTARENKDGTTISYEYNPEGHLIRETDPLGRVIEYVYDAAGQQVETRLPCDACPGGFAVSQKIYDAAGQVVQETDPLGAITRYKYDTVGRMAVITDTYGFTHTYTYDPAGGLIQERDPLGATTRYEYDPLGQLITTTNPLGFQSFNGYDPVGNIIQTTNERGYTTTFTYDANDRLVESTDALGNRVQHTYDGAGRLLTTIDPLGQTTIYEYDPDGNLISVTDPRGHTTHIEYDVLNRPVRQIAPLGNESTTTYDAMGRVTAEIDALGYAWLYDYDAAGRRITEQNPLGHTTTKTYDSADNLISTQDSTGAIWQFEYDPLGNQIGQTDPIGHIWQTEYDLLGRPVRETDPLGATTHWEYDAMGNIVRVTDARGATTHYQYDLLGRLLQERNALDYTYTYAYDPAGNPISEQDERGFTTTYVYDKLDRVIASTDPMDNTRYTLYDDAGQITSEIDYAGNTTNYTYDPAGNLIETIDALGGTTTTAYDPRNLPISITDPSSHTLTISYDAVGQILAETDARGYTTSYTYDASGQLVTTADAAGHTWSTEYDVAGRPVRETDPLGRSQVTGYDALGQIITATDALNRTTTYTYDPLGRLTTITGPDGTAQRYIYDPVGNLLTEHDGNNHVTRFEYDLLDRLVRKTDPLGHTWHYQYDAGGNQTGQATPGGHTISQAFDELGRLASREYDGAPQVAFAYDANGNRTMMTDTLGVTLYSYDALNQLLFSTDPAGRTVHYAYDQSGRRTSLTYPDGAIASFAYDANGNLSQVIAPDGGMTSYQYDPLGRQVLVSQANRATVETSYDPVGNITSIVQKDALGAPFIRHDYTVDDADRRIQVAETLPQGTFITTYTYDDLDRLVSSLSSDGREAIYTFDNAGNRLTQSGNRFRDGAWETYAIQYVYNAANQLLSATDDVLSQTKYSYDNDGNRMAEQSPTQRKSYNYGVDGRLTEARVWLKAGSDWAHKNNSYERYVYDGSGRRVCIDTILTVDNSLVSQRESRYDDARGWDVLQTYGKVSSATVHRYLYDEPFHKLVYWQGTNVGHFHNDALGSVLGTTDDSGALVAPDGTMRYGDYGEGLGPATALPTEDGFTGYEHDDYTGLSYARNRFYNPATGSFLTPDPYSYERDDLLDLHRYLYVQANPANSTDPLGLFKLSSLLTRVARSIKSNARQTKPTINKPTPGALPSRPPSRAWKHMGTTMLRSALAGVQRGAPYMMSVPSRSAKARQERNQRLAAFIARSASLCGRKIGARISSIGMDSQYPNITPVPTPTHQGRIGNPTIDETLLLAAGDIGLSYTRQSSSITRLRNGLTIGGVVLDTAGQVKDDWNRKDITNTDKLARASLTFGVSSGIAATSTAVGMMLAGPPGAIVGAAVGIELGKLWQSEKEDVFSCLEGKECKLRTECPQYPRWPYTPATNQDYMKCHKDSNV